jgi:hypothetical protein
MNRLPHSLLEHGYQAFDLGDLDAAVDAVSLPGKTGNVLLKF